MHPLKIVGKLPDNQHFLDYFSSERLAAELGQNNYRFQCPVLCLRARTPNAWFRLILDRIIHD
jgi:hypothetical protein